MKTLTVFPTAAAALILLLTSTGIAAPAAPPATRIETVVDTVHGVAIEDPYRWLEDGSSEEVIRWTEAQYDYFREWVDTYPGKDKISARITELMTIGSIGAPHVRDSLYFFSQRDTTQNHSVLYIKRGFDADAEVLIDPNTFSEDGTVAMDWYHLSSDGSLIAYGVSSSGSERSTLHIMRTSDRELLADTIPFTRAVALDWLPDNSGFYYTRFPSPDTIAAGDDNYYRWVYRHKLGDDYQNDALIYGPEVEKTAWTGAALSPDGTRLMIYIWRGSADVTWLYRDLSDPESEFVPLYDSIDAAFTITLLNDRFLVTTNWQAPRYRVLTGSYDAPRIENWQETIAERESIIESADVIAGHIVTNSLTNAYYEIELFTLDGVPVRTLETPTLGSVFSINGEFDGHELFYAFSSYNMPTTIYRYSFDENQQAVYERLEAGVDVSDIVVKQVWYPSKDGTKISMFLVHRDGLKLDGTNPDLPVRLWRF